MTRGLKSSEFIVTLLAMLVCTGLAYFDKGQFIMASMTVPSIYVGGRSAVKSFKGEDNA